MANEINVEHGLQSHHAKEASPSCMPPEQHASGNLVVELLPPHVGLVPSVGRDDTAVGIGRSIHDGQYGSALVVTTEPDVAHSGLSRLLRIVRDSRRSMNPK